MRILSNNEIKQSDALTLGVQGISSWELMERAANGFAKTFIRKFPNPGKGLVVCGPGNNGGDGLAIARILSEKTSVAVFLPSLFSSFSPDFLENLELLPKSVDIYRGEENDLAQLVSGFDWLGDALFGIGLNRGFGPEIQSIIKVMNLFGGLKIAIDIPSGFQEGNQTSEVVFKADWVGTFHSPKLNFLFPEAQEFVPGFEIIDIQLSEVEPQNDPIFYLEAKDVKTAINPRPKFSHKGTYGHAFLIAGSEGKMGAAVLAASAMIRSGVGLVTVFVPECGLEIIQVSVPEAMAIANHGKGLPQISHFKSIGIGPGLGKGQESQNLLKELMTQVRCPLVLDADALNILSENIELLKRLPENSVLTPHPKEFERLVGKSESNLEMLQKARQFSRENKVYLILKSAHTAICFPNGHCYINSTGNPGMAKGGSGDVLTGILTSTIAQGYPTDKACLISVYIHGLAGDLAAKEFGQIGFTISDLIKKIGPAFQCLLEEK